LPEKSSRLFEVACKNCHRTLMTVEQIRAPEIAALVEHLRRCSAEPLPDRALLGEVLARVRVNSVTR
jgi:hypothetical protein